MLIKLRPLSQPVVRKCVCGLWRNLR